MYKVLYEDNGKFQIRQNKCKSLKMAMQNAINKNDVTKEMIISNKNFDELNKKAKELKIKLVKHSKSFLMQNYNLLFNIPLRIKYKPYAKYNSRTLAFFQYNKNNAEKIELNLLLLYYGLLNNNLDDIYDTLNHELIHYALYCLNKPFDDGTLTFEKELINKNVSTSGTTNVKKYDIKPIRNNIKCISLYDLYNLQLKYNVHGKLKKQSNIIYEEHKQNTRKYLGTRICVVINLLK